MLGSILEEDAISMHCVMMTQNPPLFYWNDTTLRVMEGVYALREKGFPAYFTIDAGPNVHVICRSEDEQTTLEEMNKVNGVQSIIVNEPCLGAHSIANHLF
jgi:diphosphomevalonate decarboxylase